MLWKPVLSRGSGPNSPSPLLKASIKLEISETSFFIANHRLLESFRKIGNQAFIFHKFLNLRNSQRAPHLLSRFDSKNYTAPVFHSTNHLNHASKNLSQSCALNRIRKKSFIYIHTQIHVYKNR